MFAGGQTLVTLLLLGYALVTQLFPPLVMALVRPGWVTKWGAMAGVVAGVGDGRGDVVLRRDAGDVLDGRLVHRRPAVVPRPAQPGYRRARGQPDRDGRGERGRPAAGGRRRRAGASSAPSARRYRRALEPFAVQVGEDVLADLARRLDATRWPDEAPAPARARLRAGGGARARRVLARRLRLARRRGRAQRLRAVRRRTACTSSPPATVRRCCSCTAGRAASGSSCG